MQVQTSAGLSVDHHQKSDNTTCWQEYKVTETPMHGWLEGQLVKPHWKTL